MVDANVLIKLLESSYDGIWITDHVGKILFANSANAKLRACRVQSWKTRLRKNSKTKGYFRPLLFWKLCKLGNRSLECVITLGLA